MNEEILLRQRNGSSMEGSLGVNDYLLRDDRSDNDGSFVVINKQSLF